MSGRIVTLTLNPAVDLASTAESVIPTRKIRTTDEHVDAGGGGINVSRVIHALGGDTLALVLAGGPTGDWIADILSRAAVPARILPIAGRTRVSLTVYDRTLKQEFRFVPEGPSISAAELNAASGAIGGSEASWLVASGSLPHGVPDDTYASIARIAAKHGMRFVLDASGKALDAALHSGLDLIKPSLRELEHLVGRALPDAASQEAEALRLVRSGAARMVAVSLGADGALLATPDGVVRMKTLPGEVRSAVGAGDAFLASMVLALSKGASRAEALRWGIAAGSAATQSAGTARLTRASVEACYERLSDESAA
jgi:6-phosphofructokinase 2